jgi:PPOX class probable F420-dependent enzyme
MTDVQTAKAVEMPASHADLLTRPICGVLTTMLSDGQPQSSIVWVDYDGECACVNTTMQRHKTRAMLANPKVSLLVVDPADTSRFVQIRGAAELRTEGALTHADKMAQKYTGHPHFYGFVYPLEMRDRETRVICRIHAKRVSLDAVHVGDH